MKDKKEKVESVKKKEDDDLEHINPEHSEEEVELLFHLRRKRVVLQRESLLLSYWRRLFQGRIDIIEHILHTDPLENSFTSDDHRPLRGSTETESYSEYAQTEKGLKALAKVLAGTENFKSAKRLAQKSVSPDVVLGFMKIGESAPQMVDINGFWYVDFLSLKKADLKKYLKGLKEKEVELSRARQKSHSELDDVVEEIIKIYKKDPKVVYEKVYNI